MNIVRGIASVGFNPKEIFKLNRYNEYWEAQHPNLPKELSHMEVVQGRFEHGAIFFRAVDGIEYHQLTVQRRNINRAIDALKAANLRPK